MGRGDLSDAEWELIGPLLPPERGRWARPAGDNRRFLNGMLHALRFRSRWPPGSSVRWSYHTSHAHRGVDPDDRRQTTACRADGEDWRWRFPAHDRRERITDHHGGRRRWPGRR